MAYDTCQYRYCQNPLPSPVRTSGQPREYCNGSCRKAAFLLRQREEEALERQEAIHRLEEQWATLLPETFACLRQVISLCGLELTQRLTEAIIVEKGDADS